MTVHVITCDCNGIIAYSYKHLSYIYTTHSVMFCIFVSDQQFLAIELNLLFVLVHAVCIQQYVYLGLKLSHAVTLLVCAYNILHAMYTI